MGTNALHSVSVAAVITNDAAEVLLIQRRDNGQWEPPGGVLEVSESISHGLKREVLEETGLVIEPARLTGVYKNMARGIVALVFRAQVAGGALRSASEETAMAEWVPPELISVRCAEAYAVRVTDALNDGQPSIRAHDGVHLLSN